MSARSESSTRESWSKDFWLSLSKPRRYVGAVCVALDGVVGVCIGDNCVRGSSGTIGGRNINGGCMMISS